jgi:hypothetical protein
VCDNGGYSLVFAGVGIVDAVASLPVADLDFVVYYTIERA